MSRTYTRRQIMSKTIEDALALALFGLIPGADLFRSRRAWAQAAGTPKRLVIVLTTDGLSKNYWPSSASGQAIALSPVLTPFAGLEGNLSLVRGFVGPQGGHTSIQSTLTGANFNRDEKARTTVNSASLDQFVAAKIGGGKAFPSVALGAINDLKQDKAGESTPFFSSGGQAVAPKLNPRQALDVYYADLLGLTAQSNGLSLAGGANVNVEQVLPFLKQQTAYFLNSPRLSAIEKQKIEMHAASLQKMIESASNANGGNTVSGNLQCVKVNSAFNKDYDTNNVDQYGTIIDAYFDMMVSGLTCGKSNVFTLQLGRSSDSWVFKEVGQNLPEDVRGFDSHRLNHDKAYYEDSREGPTDQRLYDLTREMAQAASTWYAGKVAAFARRLSEMPDGNGSVLDNTLIVWASEFGPDEGKDHLVDDLGYLLIGGKNLGFASGKYFDFSAQKRANSILLSTIAQKFGVTETVGREGGTVSELYGS